MPSFPFCFLPVSSRPSHFQWHQFAVLALQRDAGSSLDVVLCGCPPSRVIWGCHHLLPSLKRELIFHHFCFHWWVLEKKAWLYPLFTGATLKKWSEVQLALGGVLWRNGSQLSCPYCLIQMSPCGSYMVLLKLERSYSQREYSVYNDWFWVTRWYFRIQQMLIICE